MTSAPGKNIAGVRWILSLFSRLRLRLDFGSTVASSWLDETNETSTTENDWRVYQQPQTSRVWEPSNEYPGENNQIERKKTKRKDERRGIGCHFKWWASGTWKKETVKCKKGNGQQDREGGWRSNVSYAKYHHKSSVCVFVRARGRIIISFFFIYFSLRDQKRGDSINYIQ